jgi:hypothetical protein
MPMFIYLKTPNIMLLAEGSLDDQTISSLGREVGGAIIIMMSGRTSLLPVKVDCNIAYVKEITQEEADEFHKRRDEEVAKRSAMEAGRKVTIPDFVIPGGIKGKG